MYNIYLVNLIYTNQLYDKYINKKFILLQFKSC